MSAEKNWRWDGAKVIHEVRGASAAALDETMRYAVGVAQATTAVRTGRLRDSIRVHRRARQLKGGVVGRWGSDLSYARIQEFSEHGTPYLRPAAAAAEERMAAILARRLAAD